MFTDEQLMKAMGFTPLGLTLTCPSCQAGGQAQATHAPVVGEVVTCFECAAPLVITSIDGEAIGVREATDEDLAALPDDLGKILRENQKAIAFFNCLGGDAGC